MKFKKWRQGKEDDRLASYEKIRKKHSLLKTKEQMRENFELDLKAWDEKEEKISEDDSQEPLFRARVVEVHKRYAFVSVEKGSLDIDTRDVWLATIARKFLMAKRTERNLICVGDYVLCQPAKRNIDVEEGDDVPDDLPQCMILHMMPREAQVYRQDPTNEKRFHVLASNMKHLFITASILRPKVRWGLVDRYLALAESQHLPATIILNKKDLLDDPEAKPEFIADVEEKIQLYRELGYQVILFQANAKNVLKSEGFVQIEKIIKDAKLVMFSGHSGVGKSSIVNLFYPEIEQSVEENADIFYKGRHTTTFASLLRLKNKAFVIDTPGVRSYAFQEQDPIALTDAFVEMRPFLGQCKYRSCRHIDEPGCVILAAVAEGKINPSRYKSYSGILLGETGREGSEDISPSS